MKVASASLSVDCVESALHRHRKRSETFLTTLWRWEQDVEMPKVLEGPYKLRLKINVPTTIPPTFVGVNHSLRTTVRFALVLEDSTDLFLEQELIIRPEVIS